MNNKRKVSIYTKFGGHHALSMQELEISEPMLVDTESLVDKARHTLKLNANRNWDVANSRSPEDPYKMIPKEVIVHLEAEYEEYAKRRAEYNRKQKQYVLDYLEGLVKNTGDMEPQAAELGIPLNF